MLLEESEHRRFRPFAVDVAIDHGRRVVEKVLPYANGRCQFLGDDDRCLIYDDRPMNCRRFQCVDFFHHRGSNVREHGRFLQLNEDVLALLERF